MFEILRFIIIIIYLLNDNTRFTKLTLEIAKIVESELL